jgi:hypothetical protein
MGYSKSNTNVTINVYIKEIERLQISKNIAQGTRNREQQTKLKIRGKNKNQRGNKLNRGLKTQMIKAMIFLKNKQN